MDFRPPEQPVLGKHVEKGWIKIRNVFRKIKFSVTEKYGIEERHGAVNESRISQRRGDLVAVDIKSYTAKMYCLAISLPYVYFRAALKSIRSAHTHMFGLFFVQYQQRRPCKPGLIAQAWHPSHSKAETGGLQTQGQPGLQSELEGSLGNSEIYFKVKS